MAITLKEIRAAADKKYGSFDIELADGTEVQLLNPLRLSAESRAKLEALQDKEDADENTFIETLTALAATPAQAKKLLKEVGDDLAVMAEIIESYSKETEAGEA